MPPLNLRSYRPSDLAAMHALDTLCFEPPFCFSSAAMRRFIEADNALIRLACVFDEATAVERIVAFCIVHLEQIRRCRVGYVVTLDVAPAWRGQGVARALLAELEHEAAQAGARAMSLHVFSGNATAIRLYERLGYEQVRTQKSFYGTGLDALVYSKPLVPEGRSAGDAAVAQSGR